MTLTLERPSTEVRPSGGSSVVARRAVARWAWRLFRREWRQQLLILTLVIVAVAATVVGATVATTTPSASTAGFGTAQDMMTLQGPSRLSSEVATLQRRFGSVDVIANETIAVPGSVQTFQLRAQNPHGPFGQPMLSLLSGRYPAGAGQTAISAGLATELNLRVGATLRANGTTRTVVGIVQNPQSLLDEFALVVPAQVRAPSQVTILFDAHGTPASSIGPNVATPASVTQSNVLNPTTIVLTLATLGMLLIALVGIGGFTVLAQRRMRSIGMLGSLGATDRNIRLVVRANGVVVGVVGAGVGFLLGLGAWLIYRPHAEASAHHVIGAMALPWNVILPAMVLAVAATYFAASRPARAVTRIPIVTALSGRPAPPKKVSRSAIPGVIVGVIAFLLLGAAGSARGGGGAGPLVLGLVALIIAVVLLSPFCLTVLGMFARRVPISGRLALRDLVRYRSRSGSALATITIGILIAVIVCVVAAARYGNVLDYAGPNVASNQLIVYSSASFQSSGPGTLTASGLRSERQEADSIGAALGASNVVQLDTPSANLEHAGAGRQFNGQVFVATPQLLRAFGITTSDFIPSAEVLTARPGLAGVSNMQLQHNDGSQSGSKTQTIEPGSGPVNGPGDLNGPGANSYPCPVGSCLANPLIQEVSALPSGTSAPNTVVTEHTVQQFHLQLSTQGWLILAPHPLTAAQITTARLAASTAGMTIESKNDQPTSSEIINWATVFGIGLALGILAMSIGLIRSETASDLRILSATGASSRTRRNITAATAGALGLLGALVGTVAGYVATIGYLSSNTNDGLGSLANVPVTNLLIIVIGMPLVAAAVGWLLAGRQPASMTHQPVE